MQKRILQALCAGVVAGVLLMGTVVAYASDIMARKTTSTILVDGERVDIRAYNINGRNYFQLRDLGAVVGFGVDWDGENDTVLILTEGNTEKPEAMPEEATDETTALRTASKILVDGEEADIEAYNVNDRNYFQLRDLGEAVGFYVDWDEESNTVLISTIKEEPTPEPTEEPTESPTEKPTEAPEPTEAPKTLKEEYRFGELIEFEDVSIKFIDMHQTAIKDKDVFSDFYDMNNSTSIAVRFDITENRGSWSAKNFIKKIVTAECAHESEKAEVYYAISKATNFIIANFIIDGVEKVRYFVVSDEKGNEVKVLINSWTLEYDWTKDSRTEILEW